MRLAKVHLHADCNAMHRWSVDLCVHSYEYAHLLLATFRTHPYKITKNGRIAIPDGFDVVRDTFDIIPKQYGEDMGCYSAFDIRIYKSEWCRQLKIGLKYSGKPKWNR